ncbi:MAG TPA: SDR family NAD(P)-dependent oxidoreductase, partial [Polyangiaceae bacterium]|nr:SDR family NAD(P)-dependent oxidoreductase [Polyangiaceae bacterium]
MLLSARAQALLALLLEERQPMTASLKPINQQVIVITGASSGIGLATALEAAGRGAKLVLAARSGQTLEKVVADITSAGGEAVAVTADVSSYADLERVAQVAIERFGRIDTWINNAAVGIYGRLDEISEADSRRLFDINFWGVVNGSRIALPLLRATGGALINL